MDIKGKVVLIVGASSGMGRVLAIRMGREGALVVATARRAELLATLADAVQADGGHCLPLVADACDAASAQEVIDTCISQYGRIDMLLLNAGGAPALNLRELSAAEVLAYMRSNYDVAVNYLVPGLRQMSIQRSGLVVCTNSLAGFLGVPLQGPYSAAKGALRLLIDTCRIEFAEFGIKFVSVYPGFVATEAVTGDGMPAPLEISEDQAAEHILYAIDKETQDYLFPFSMRWLIRLARVLPKSLTNWILRQMLQAETK